MVDQVILIALIIFTVFLAVIAFTPVSLFDSLFLNKNYLQDKLKQHERNSTE